MSSPDFSLSLAQVASLTPELALVVGGSLLLLLEAFAPALRRTFLWLGLVAVGVASWAYANAAAGPGFSRLVEATPLTAAFCQAILLATGLGLLSAQGYLTREKLLAGEYPALLLWCAAGLCLLVRSTDLLSIFLSLELASVCLYGLAAFHRREAVSAEAGIKYFLMGAFVSAFLLYGIALVYGETGSTALAGISEAIAAGRGTVGLLTLGFLLIVAAFGFKLGLVPFHAWAPDVYQGAPTPFVAFLSVAPKVASAVVMVRVVRTIAEGPLGPRWSELVAVLAIASMLLGNLFALVQRDIKRMLAYSGIAHMGYVMIPLASPGPDSWRPILVYLIAYVLMNAGAFGIVGMLYAHPGEQHPIAALSGWGFRFPALAACLTICLLSLGGIPPTAGFLGKYLVFLHAIEHRNLGLALVGIAASLVGVVYYLRVVYMLYMKPETAAPKGLVIDFSGRLAGFVAAGATLLLGLLPGALLERLTAALTSL
jgi:NADH-quinone oxidoreductase subunit N